ncbi:MAG: 5-formyltetrahydrofolate cyclo-ligase [Pseudohongiellaceae bacterium]
MACDSEQFVSVNSAPLRAHFRAERRSISLAQQHESAQQLAAHFRRSAAFHHAESIAFYLAADGELSVEFLLEAALAAGKRCFLPVAKIDDCSMRFLRYEGDASSLTANPWGILEPDPSCDTIAATDLDLVLVPLVACDKHGNRLGRGKGFYDRAFEFMRASSAPANPPLLVGIAHECQICATPLPHGSWDVPLAAVATPTRMLVSSTESD